MKGKNSKKPKKDRGLEQILAEISAETRYCLTNGLCVNCSVKLPPLNEVPKKCLSCGFSLEGFKYNPLITK